MKTFVAACLASLVIAAATAQTPPATNVDPKDAKKAAPAATAAPAKKEDGKKKDDKMGKIEGMEIARGTGFIGIQILNGVFKLTVYDAKKKPMASDFTKVALRWTPVGLKNPERALLTPSGGVGVFSSDKVVRPPHQFRLFVTLIKGEGDDAPVENLVVEFKA